MIFADSQIMIAHSRVCKVGVASYINVALDMLDISLLSADEPTGKLAAKDATFKEVMILALPMLFDLTATLLMSIGLL